MTNEYLFLGIIVLLVVNGLAHYRLYALPLHPDTGHSIYWILLGRLGHRFRQSQFRIVDGVPIWFGGWTPFVAKCGVRVLVRLGYFFFGNNVRSFRLAYFLPSCISLGLIITWVWLMWGPFPALLAGFAYLIMSLSPYLDSCQTHTEQLTVPLLLAAIMCISMGVKTDSIALSFLGGLLLPITVFSMKITHLVDTFVILISPFFFIPDLKLQILHFLMGCTGFALGAGLYLLVAYVKVKDYKLLMSYFNPFYLMGCYRKKMLGDFNIEEGISGLNIKKLFQMGTFFMGPGVSFAFFFIYCLIGGWSRLNLFILIMIVSNFLTLIIQKKFYMSHFFMLLPAISIGAGVGLGQLLYYNSLEPTWYILCGIVLCIVAYTISTLDFFRYYVLFDSLKYHLHRFSVMRHKLTLGFLAVELIAKYIKDNTKPDDRILMWGYHHELYVFAQRRSALGPRLEQALHTDYRINDSYYGPVWRRWILEDIDYYSPVYIVDMDGTFNPSFVKKTIGLNYEIDKIFYDIYPLYKLKGKEKEVYSEDNEALIGGNPELNVKFNGGLLSREDYILCINRIVNENRIDKLSESAQEKLHVLTHDWKKIAHPV